MTSVRYPRVLVGTPIYDGKEYCRERFVENVKAINYPNFHWCLVDNSKNPRYYHKLRRAHPGHVWRVPRGSNSRDALANSSNFLREKALKEGYDFLLMLESDIFPPKDVLSRLVMHGRPVVGAIYNIGDGKHDRLCLFKLKFKPELGIMGTELVGMDEQKDFIHKGLREVHGMGVGCTLIERSILERFGFWYSSADDMRMAHTDDRKHPDVYFYMDLHNNGIKVYADTDIICAHEYSAWGNVADV